MTSTMVARTDTFEFQPIFWSEPKFLWRVSITPRTLHSCIDLLTRTNEGTLEILKTSSNLSVDPSIGNKRPCDALSSWRHGQRNFTGNYRIHRTRPAAFCIGQAPNCSEYLSRRSGVGPIASTRNFDAPC